MMRWRPRTLRGRLAAGHTLVVLVSIAAFAWFASALSAEMQRADSDKRLRTSAASLRVLFARTGPRSQRAALLAVRGGGVHGAVVDRGGRVLDAPEGIPAAVAAVFPQMAPFPTVTKLHAEPEDFRVVKLALDGKVPSYGLFWRAVDTFDDIDLQTSLAFAIAVPLIAAAAFFAGDLITRRALAPLNAVAATAASIESRDLSRRIAPVPDVAEIADLSATLNRMFERLESAFARQRRFTADASHEFRTPLSVIIAEADLAAGGLASDAEYRQAMRLILREAKLIEAMTHDLLVLAREESGAPAIREPVDLANAVTCAVERLYDLARSRRITMRARCTEPALVAGNPTSIARIPIALLHNALKFSDEGTRIDVTVDVVDDAARLVIEDEGPGFSDEGLARAFDRFWRADTHRDGEGSGLGLAIVKSLVDAAHGTIVLTNRLPRGCRVTVAFPAIGRAAAADSTDSASVQPVRVPSPSALTA
ncbi:MAG: HAMP domain-containing protein [Candidatus Eremiobacteraeota bacterium]|nr:HAMP domain-containing protein [Candidatus Eremiobacteraeota bacterium]